MTKNCISIGLFMVISGCAEMPAENNAMNNPPPMHSPTVQNTDPLKTDNAPNRRGSTAMINFIGNVTAKKANDLTSYVHKEMNNGVKHFIININSPGGETDAGISVYQYLKALPITITTHNIGNVQSSAAIIYCSGSQRYSLPYSLFMLHGSSTLYNGGMSLTTIESLSKLNKMRLNAFTDIFSHCTQMNHDKMDGYFSSADAHYFTADEAKAIGLVQHITAPPFTLPPLLIYNITD